MKKKKTVFCFCIFFELTLSTQEQETLFYDFFLLSTKCFCLVL